MLISTEKKRELHTPLSFWKDAENWPQVLVARFAADYRFNIVAYEDDTANFET